MKWKQFYIAAPLAMTDSFLDEVATSPPNRIDIYVDGCALSVGKTNPRATAGWGAVVVETTNGEVTSVWRASDSLESASSSGAEVAAALGGIHAVRQLISSLRHCDKMPKIVLHTDQVDLHVAIERALIPLSGDTEPSHAMLQLARLIEKTGVKIEYTKATKSRSNIPTIDSQLMDAAHDMAGIAAWEKRLELQEGVLGQAGAGFLSKEDSAKRIADMQHAGEARWQQLIKNPELEADFAFRKGSVMRAPEGKMSDSLTEDAIEEIRRLRRLRRDHSEGGGPML